MNSREFKGLELAARANIEFRKTYWYVPSASHEGGYRVDADATTCACEDFELRQMPCKHIHAVRIVKDRNRGKPIPDTDTVDAPPARKTYSQNWSAYNKAQRNEKEMFQELLADLCKTIPWAAKEGRGRPRLPLPDAIFSACFKVYSNLSGRRFDTDLRDARDAGHIDAAPHYNSVFRVLEDPNTTPVLRALIVRTSLPLRGVETDFAVDSTGFGTSKFDRWFDHKYGVERKKAQWIKCHIATGVKTNIVTACEVNDAGDSPMFRQLAATTATNFPVREFSADKAYSSFENLQYAESLGAVPYVPFKVNSRGDSGPLIWERMHAMFTLNRDEFLTHYHKRSNVESTFSAIKRKFGDSVRSKTDVAIKNEVLAKVVCHNIVVVIHEMHELGIDPTFGKPTREREPAILKFPGTA
jgi:transposase